MISRKRLIIFGLIGAAVLFALQGGQYSTLDLLSQRSRKTQIQSRIDSLQKEIDSLTAYRKELATNPRLQERIAREMWGMSKEGEIVYRIK